MQVPNQTNAGYNMPAMVQNYPMSQNPPMVPMSNVQNQAIGQNYPFVQNIGFVLSTAPVPPAGVFTNTDPRTRPERQMFGGPTHAHSTPAEYHAAPYANTVITQQPAQYEQPLQSAQRVQPPQPVAPQKSMDETVEEVKVFLKEKDFILGRIRNSRDVLRYSEAEKRLNRKLTPDLAADYPSTEAEEHALINELALAIRRHVTHPRPKSTQQGINCIKSQKGFTVELVAGKLIVFKPQDPLKVEST